MKPIDSLNDDEFAHLVQRAVALPDAPPSLVRAAVDLWPAPPAAALKSAAQAAVRLVAAVLSFDSWARPPAALGLRATASDTRYLLFSAMGRNIDLRIIPAADHFELAGQILGPDMAGVIELLTQSGDRFKALDAHVAALDAMGEFRLDGVRSGTYRLTLRTGGNEIVLSPIEVGTRPR